MDPAVPADTVVPLGPGPTGGSTASTVPIDLTEGDNVLCVDISDALSERDWVKFTVHTRTSMPRFAQQEFSVIRLHEEFIWLHDTIQENPEYAGYIIPPPPPRPDFDASREKLRKLGDAEGNLTKEEFNKMKQELEAEYLATFKKTVAMHETFVCRLAAHPIFRDDMNLAIFLEYDKELAVRGKNKKERFQGFMASFQKSGDELLLSNTLKDVDEFFDAERTFLLEYHGHLKEATHRSDRMTTTHKLLADNYIKLSSALVDLAALEAGTPSTVASTNGETDKTKTLETFLMKTAEAMEKMRRIEGRVATDQDLKMSDALRYHMHDTVAAKDLLFRRLRCLANYENANKNLDRARAKNRDIPQAETDQQKAVQQFEKISEHAKKLYRARIQNKDIPECEKLQEEAVQHFEKISSDAKDELKTLKERRVVAFQKCLTELAELELKHSKAHAQMLRAAVASLKAEL